MKCRYGNSETYRRLIPVVEELVLDYTDAGPDSEARANETVAELQRHLQDFSPYLKQGAFKSERNGVWSARR
jgi:hypothetical protein